MRFAEAKHNNSNADSLGDDVIAVLFRGLNPEWLYDINHCPSPECPHHDKRDLVEQLFARRRNIKVVFVSSTLLLIFFVSATWRCTS